MRNLLMAAATGALLVAAVPASAQVYMGADPGGAGVIREGRACRWAHSASASGRAMATIAGAVTNIAVTHIMPMAPNVLS